MRTRRRQKRGHAKRMYNDFKGLYPERHWEIMKEKWPRDAPRQIKDFCEYFTNSVTTKSTANGVHFENSASPVTHGESKPTANGKHSLLLKNFNRWMHTITGGKPLTVEQHKQKLKELGITAIESIARMSVDSTRDNNGKSVSLHSDSTNDFRPAPAAGPHIIDLTTGRDAVHHSQSVSKSNTQIAIEDNCSVSDDVSPSEKHSSPASATGFDPAVDDAADEDVGSASPQRQSVLKSSESDMSPSRKHSSPALATNNDPAADDAANEDARSASPQRQSVLKSNEHAALNNLATAAEEVDKRSRSQRPKEVGKRSLSQTRKATLREKEKQESEKAKRRSNLFAIVKEFKDKNKKSQQTQKLTQEVATKRRSKQLIEERKRAELQAQALKNNPDQIKLMLLDLAKTRRERDDFKNQGNSDWCTRHMSVKTDHHDVFLKYVEEVSRRRFGNSDEFDTGFKTERWYDLNASEMKVRNYYVFEYIITHFTCVCVCVCVCVCARVCFQRVTTRYCMLSLHSNFGLIWI